MTGMKVECNVHHGGMSGVNGGDVERNCFKLEPIIERERERAFLLFWGTRCILPETENRVWK